MLSATPLILGTLGVDRSTLTFMRGFGERVDVPVVAWLLRDGSRTWLVDTGGPDGDAPTAAQARRTPAQTLEAQLGVHGVAPEDVDLVLLTHLHFDHVGGISRLPRARFVVQRAELEYARDPLPVHARGYLHPRAGFPARRWDDANLEVVDGDHVVSDDLRLLLTPGHTPGLQAVEVETAEGTVVLASDNVPLHENWAGAPPLEPHIPSGVHVDLRDCYASFARLEALERDGATVLPSHDPALAGEAPARPPAGHVA